MFNSLVYTKKLEESGFKKEQAETSVNVLFDMMENHLATKQDVHILRQETANVRTELKQEIADVRKELKQEIADLRRELKQEIADLRTEMNHRFIELESRLTIKLGAMMAASIAIMTALQKLT